MADYKLCAWYQKGTCIRDDKSGAPISCADCEDYERRVVFKIEDLQERNGEMSVRKSCYNCKHYKKGVCGYEKYSGVACVTENMDFWELSDDAKADMLHDAEPEHDAVNHPSHYTAGGIECIEALKAATTRLRGIEAVCTANAIKYLWQWKDKNGAEDIRKAIWYCERLLKEIGDEQT